MADFGDDEWQVRVGMRDARRLGGLAFVSVMELGRRQSRSGESCIGNR